jgi:hypothetical protein
MDHLPDGLTLRTYQRVGRSLQSTKEYFIGDLVLEDTPVLEWSADCTAWPLDVPDLTTAELLAARPPLVGDSGEGAAPPAGELQVPSFLIAAAAAYCTSSTTLTCIERRCILDMHVPDLPIGIAFMDASLFCERLSRRLLMSPHFLTRIAAASPQQQHSTWELFQPCAILHVMLAAKVNAHRGPTGTWRMYRYGSKLAHSCDPNCAYIAQRGAFVAIRPIAKQTLITFSYLGGPPLMQPAELRQRRLQSSHLFICQCARCRGHDAARTFPCPSCQRGVVIRRTSMLLDSEDDLLPGNLGWACSGCGHSAGDSDLYVAQLLDGESSLWRNVMIDLGDAGRPYKLHELTSCLERCVLPEESAVDQLTSPLLGRHCWLYGVLMMHFGRYFTTFGKTTADVSTLGLAARCLCVGIAVHARVTGVGSMLTVSATTQLAEVYRMLALVRDMPHVPEHEMAGSFCRGIADGLLWKAIQYADCSEAHCTHSHQPSPSSSSPIEWMGTVRRIAEAMRTTTDCADDRWRMEEKKLQFLTFLIDDISKALPEASDMRKVDDAATVGWLLNDCQSIESDILVRVKKLRVDK